MSRDLIDTDGENLAVRWFLALYGGTSSPTVPQMRAHLENCGFPYWPEWAKEEQGHLTKGGAQDWIRHLFALESAAAPVSEQPADAGCFANAEIRTLRRLIECAEELNKHPRPMCRDCADEDGTCPTSGLECDMRKLFADAKTLHDKLARLPGEPVAQSDGKDARDAEQAAMYRWLRERDNFPGDEGDGPSLWDQLCELECDEFDDFICAAMAQQSKGGA